MNKKEKGNSNLNEVMEAASSWTKERKSTYYDPELNKAGEAPSRSAREILAELGLKL